MQSFQFPQEYIKIKLILFPHMVTAKAAFQNTFKQKKFILSKLSNRKDIFIEWQLFPRHWETFLKSQHLKWQCEYSFKEKLTLEFWVFLTSTEKQIWFLNRKGKAETRRDWKKKLTWVYIHVRVASADNIFLIFSVLYLIYTL